MSTYVYGFAPATHPMPIDGLTGVGAERAPVRLIREDGLVAVVSDAPEGLRAKRRDLEAHERVLESLCAAGTVMPMRFGMVASDDATVQAELTSKAEKYADLLAKLNDHVELNVKGVHDEDALLGDLLQRHAELRERNDALRAVGGGDEQDRIAFGEQVSAAVEERRVQEAKRLVAQLESHATRVRLGPSVEGCFVNASFLVANSDREAFDAAVTALRDAANGYADVRVFGPLPPYSFVEVDGADEADG
ncbi:MAG TPA: GvpL/GvpF family gas vesicle protein [Nocardioidaceae bacterium]|nr:GvpL/GvpF family gas vesicle protein [Nocardioidaceae bacterium]